MANRPISPHLQIWKWGPHMATSILHRITGQGLTFLTAAKHPLGMVVLVGLSWAFFTHLCSGLRHLVLDTGANYELHNNKIGSIVSMTGGVVLTIIFWAVIVSR